MICLVSTIGFRVSGKDPATSCGSEDYLPNGKKKKKNMKKKPSKNSWWSYWIGGNPWKNNHEIHEIPIQNVSKITIFCRLDPFLLIVQLLQFPEVPSGSSQIPWLFSKRLGPGVCTLHHRGVVQSTEEHVEDVSIPRIPHRHHPFLEDFP